MEYEIFLGLKKIAFFANLNDSILSALADKAKLVRFQKQASIMSEGDESNSLFIILSGKVRIYSSGSKNKEFTLIVQEAGSYFGELALLSNEPRSASVVALDTTVCATITKTVFINWLMAYPEAAIILLSEMSGKVRQLTEKVKQLALSNVYERTIQTLESLAVAEGNVKIIYKRPTQQELATMVGASREMVNKILHELIKGGHLVIEEEIMIIKSKFPASW